MKFLRKELEPTPDGGSGDKEAGMSAKGSAGTNTFLGKGCSFDGKLTFDGTVTIDGRFTGEIFSDDILEVGPDADIKAAVDVGTVIVGGRVIGNIVAKNRADLRSGADVVGNITAPIVTMQEGAVLDGALKMVRKANSAEAAAGKAPLAASAPVKPVSAIKPRDPTSLP